MVAKTPWPADEQSGAGRMQAVHAFPHQDLLLLGRGRQAADVGADGHGGVPAQIESVGSAASGSSTGKPMDRADWRGSPCTASRAVLYALCSWRIGCIINGTRPNTAQHGTAQHSAPSTAQRALTSRARPASAAHPWGCPPARGLHQGAVIRVQYQI